jgi:hypothetical protein
MTEVRFPKQYVKVPKSFTIEEDNTVTAVWEDRVCMTHQELQTAIGEISKFRKDTEGRKINNATEVVESATGMSTKKPNSSNRPHINEAGTTDTKK